MATVRLRTRWPSLRRIVLIWAGLTLIAMAGFVTYARTLPPDELVMANTLSFQVMVSALVVGLPSFGLPLLFLLVGAILKRRLRHGRA